MKSKHSKTPKPPRHLRLSKPAKPSKVARLSTPSPASSAGAGAATTADATSAWASTSAALALMLVRTSTQGTLICTVQAMACIQELVMSTTAATRTMATLLSVTVLVVASTSGHRCGWLTKQVILKDQHEHHDDTVFTKMILQ